MTLLSTPAVRRREVAARRLQLASKPSGHAARRRVAQLVGALRRVAGGHQPHGSISDVVLADIRGVHSVHR